MTTQQADAIVIGAGHNGLACAGYLARAGLKVHVVERAGHIGGAALTEEFHPGYRNSVFSYLVSLLDARVIRDLALKDHGLELIKRPGGSLQVLDGDHMYLPRDPAAARAALARFSEKDAGRFQAFEDMLERFGDLVRALAAEPPPNFGGGIGDLMTLLGTANRMRKLTVEDQATLAELMTMSIGDFLDRWFESDPIKGLFGFEGVIGNFQGPYEQGTAYVLLHHVFGQIDGQTGAWAYAKGGMGAITQAMAGFARAKGAVIETEAEVVEITRKGGRTTGVLLADGRRIEAPVVAANCHPRILYGQLLPLEEAPDAFRAKVGHWRSESATFRMNLALSELPKFDTVPHDDTGLTAMQNTIDICPSLPYLQAAHDDARRDGWAKAPIVSMCIPSISDPTLAPEGHHVMSLFCQHFRRHLPDGRSWDDVRETVADGIVDTVAAYCPNLKGAIVGRQIHSPLDIERRLNMVGGDIFHGKLALDQIYSLRPAAGYADHRMPLGGLYLCGSGAHPGGGVSGIPGRNAALAALKDLKRGRVENP
ncbi:NAD(P)/FAD-dependent oxidoreductase [Marivibrio halodurans]|uniref:Pyridine nucleotide-disulfide oxidoreductase domain-containing protein 2 n=1 Tax=Marivibrio halodurans TaxID=2039722 RepID=A0A8J7S5U8_9PROT|nr:NAD(P)/FAD-dependent oxidoreductase [Marivibrio halodurans]MBP5857319.1 NAD(P)/FAD-dependent oxidoreductase [Marivibrio halodurans]